MNGACIAVCGNSKIESPEECDDGNKNNNDGCSSTCKREVRTFNFTDCGKSGYQGPSQSQCNTAYGSSGTKVTVTNGYQFWTVPYDATFRITAYGPAGKARGATPGRGAIMRGDFALKKGDVLKILVGQQSDYTGSRDWYGGSGGTFVATNTNQALIVAGGGGGPRSQTGSNPTVSDACTCTSGKNASRTGSNWGLGGKNGAGGLRGRAATGSHTPGGGAGFTGNGQVSDDRRYTPPNPTAALSFINGGLGGIFKGGDNLRNDGGFGGGGSSAWGGAGGGGGYSGGGGDPNTGWSGGGGSFNKGTNQSNTVGNTGRGKVVIQAL